MIGYGGTDAPNSLDFYTYKRAADDIKELAHQLHAPKIILGGHDWVRIRSPFPQQLPPRKNPMYILLLTPTPPGRSNRPPHRPLVSKSHNPRFHNLHTLHASIFQIHRTLTPHPIPLTKFRIPTPTRKRRSRESY